MKIGEAISINGTLYRIIKQDESHFCLNNLEKGGCVCHVSWWTHLLKNYFSQQAIAYDIEQGTIGIYSL